MKKFGTAIPFLVVIGIWITYRFWLPLVIDHKNADLAGAGTFGDAYGALNTLFSGLAFAGIIISIYLQSKELADTREELRGQKEQLERQAFENTFFQMLRLQNEIVDSFKYVAYMGAGHYSGHACFAAMKADLDEYLQIPTAARSRVERYERYYNNHAHWTLGHYFRNLYQIVKYVDRSNVIDKKFYTNIIRAQLSSDTLFLLFWNAMSAEGREKFKPLIVRYQLLEHLPQTGQIERADALEFGSDAFGNNPDWLALLHPNCQSISIPTLNRQQFS